MNTKPKAKAVEPISPEAALPQVAGIERSIEVLVAEIGHLVELRRPHALAASQGDTVAKAKLAELSEREARARSEQRDLALALDTARAQLAEAEAIAKQAEGDARQAEFAHLAELQHEDAREIDRLLAAVGPLRSRMLTRSIAMQKLGVADAVVLSRIHAPGLWQRALSFHGFGAIAGLRRDHSHHWQSLEAAVGQMIGRPTAALAKAAA